MPVLMRSIIHQAARNCYQTAEDAREALGFFFVPNFPLNFNDLSHVNIAAILKARSESLPTIDDDNDEDDDIGATLVTEEITATITTISTTIKSPALEKARGVKRNAADISEENIITACKRPTKSRQAALTINSSMPPTKKICKIILKIIPKPSSKASSKPKMLKGSRKKRLPSPPDS
ncbi:hypothetical protein IFR05_009556 [Cadophora sp. M221]|nr:hypothetical protein IFR05_009556 [Cadophora sp. M221]